MESETTPIAQGRFYVGQVYSVIWYLELISSASAQHFNQETFSFPSGIAMLLWY